MASFSMQLIKKTHIFFMFIIMEALLYVMVNRYYLKDTFVNLVDNKHIAIYHTPYNESIDFLNLEHFNCTDDQYPNNYYRKAIHRDNYTYYAYAISVGKIFAEQLTPKAMEIYKNKIRSDLLNSTNINRLNRSDPRKAVMYETYLQYYYDFHFPPNSSIRCDKFSTNESIDFFQFIQIDGLYTNETYTTSINFYNMSLIEPMKHVLPDELDPYYININITNKSNYILPKLYSYTVSVNESGDLLSLELRFVDIVDELQHDATRHLLLNGVRGQLLWAGEFYFIYDHKYNQYVLLMDSASGHFRPDMKQKPKYMEYILLNSLFPQHMKHVIDGYQPLKLIGFKDEPWNIIKHALFPVVEAINERDWNNYVQKRAAEGRALLKLRPCHIMMGEFAQRLKKKKNTTLKSAMKHSMDLLQKFDITCDPTAVAVNNGWKNMNEYKEMIVYQIFAKYVKHSAKNTGS